MSLKLDGVAKEAVLDQKKVDNGVWVHLDSARTNSETGLKTPMYLNGDETKPQRALVRSQRCKLIKDAEAARQKSGFVKIRLAKKRDRDNVIAESSILPEAERFGYLLAALENFGADGGIQEVSPEDARALHGMTEYDDIVQQIREAAYDDDLYLATPETPAGNSSTSASKTTISPAKPEGKDESPAT